MVVAMLATIAGAVLLAVVIYDAARLVSVQESRYPPVARLRGQEAALEVTEAWAVGLLLNGRITPEDYRSRMALLARGQRTPTARDLGAAPTADPW